MKSLLLSSLLLVAACGGQVAQPIDGGTTNDAGTKDVTTSNDATPPPVDANVTCNDVAPLASTITIQMVAQDAPPTATNSPPPQAGTYYLESATIYTGANGPSGPSEAIAVTLRIDDDITSWHTVTVSNDKPDRRNFSIAKQALGLTLNGTCGGSAVTPVTFLAISSPGFVMQLNAPQPAVYLFRPFKK